jgi:hypothetical protein
MANFNNHLYRIFHKPSGLFYIGIHNKHALIRFEEHLHGFGSIAIASLVEDGATRNDFELQIISSHQTPKKSREAESALIEDMETFWPLGLNTGNRISSFKVFKRLEGEYREQGWCLKDLDLEVSKLKIRKNSALQDRIEMLAKNQNFEKCLSIFETERLRHRFRISYAGKENFASKDMSKFFEARGKEYERMRTGNKTEAEKIAALGRSSSMKKVWGERDPHEKIAILQTRSSAGGVARVKQRQAKESHK